MGEPRDGGFTLIEVIVVIGLMALVASVLAAVVAVVVRTEGPANVRAVEAGAVRGLDVWLAQDVASVPPSGFDLLSGTVTGCVGSSPGTSIVHFTWSQESVTYIVNYRYEADGTEHAIRRYTCSGSGVGPYANTSSIVITRSLDSMPPVVTPISGTGGTVGVTIDATTRSGGAIRVSARSHNPAQTLPTTTTTTP